MTTAILTRSDALSSSTQNTPKTGSALLCDALEAHGVSLMFGYPGGAAMPFYGELPRRSRLRHVLVRHEQNAALAADGYARASGRPGVCVATSGPGATNLLTGIANAMMDSTPVLALTGQVPTAAIGTLAFQEVDIVSMARPVTKAAFQAHSAAEVPALVAEAFRIMLDGRPGPVLLDLPKDVLAGTATADEVRAASAELGLSSGPIDVEARDPWPADAETLDAVASLLDGAARPALLAGQGVLIAGATDSLRELAERANVPVITTLLGLGAIPESHPLAFGMVGMHGTVGANLAVHHADLVIGVGARFDDRVVGKISGFAPGAAIVHVDVDPAAFGRTMRCDVPVLGDARTVLDGLLARVRRGDHAPWLGTIRSWAAEHADCLDSAPDALESPAVIRTLREETGGRMTLVVDVGQHQMYAALHTGVDRPGSFFTSGGAGTMGYAVPAAMGVKLARPWEEVWAVVGDGGFQMSAPELTTLAANGIDVKMMVLNNGCLGMVRMWQELYYEGVYSQVILPGPDFARLAEAHGCAARRVERRSELADAIRWARATSGPVVLDIRIPREEMLMPFVQPGATNGEVTCADGPAPCPTARR